MKGVERDTHLLQQLGQYADMNAAELARAVGVSKSTIWRPATGKSSSRLSQPVLDKLKATFPHFAGWKEYLGADAGATDASSSSYGAREIAWIDLLGSLSPSDLDLVLQLARRLQGDEVNTPSPAPEGTADFWGERKERRGR